MTLEKEKKEKERRKRRKEIQKQKKKLNPNNLLKSNQSKPLSFSASSLSIGPFLPQQNDLMINNSNMNINIPITASNDYYKSVIIELLQMPISISSRKIIISFFNRILEEYEKVGNSQTDQETKKQWNDRAMSIHQSLEILSNNMKKNHKTIPDSIIIKLLEIRKALLEGNVLKAESAYLDMDVGNMVVNNSAFFDLKIDVTTLFTCLTNMKRLINFYRSTILNKLNDCFKQTK